MNGNVEADTLIKKLLRSGKHAELWPQTTETKKEKKPGKPKNNDKQMEAKDGQEVGGDDYDKQDAPVKPENAIAIDKPQESADIKGGESKEETAGGSGGKKKKKKGQTGNGGGENVGDATAAASPDPTAGSPMATLEPIPFMARMNISPPQLDPPNHRQYPSPPPTYYPPPTPMNGVGYNTAYATANTSYYASAMHTYSYCQPPAYTPFPPSDPIYDAGCSIM